MKDVYKILATHLDNLPGGFPETEDGLEIRILKRLFTPQEAEIAVTLTMTPEEVATIAGRTGKDAAALAPILEEMAGKGLIFRKSKGEKNLYSAAMFVVGIWEYHLNDLDEGLVRDVNAYLPLLAKETWLKHPTKQLRVIPVSKQVAAGITVSSYEDAEALIKRQSKIVIQPCICRKEHDFIGEKCTYPMDVCFSFGTAAYYYEKNNLGRTVGTEEALEILETGRKAGLVVQPGNSQKPTNICMCCGCCCQILKNTKALEKPAQAVHSNYYTQVDEALCEACGICVERCHMDAITLTDSAAYVDPDRCIGCGVCVPECPVDALLYKQKAPAECYAPPKNVFETYMKIAEERGLI